MTTTLVIGASGTVGTELVPLLGAQATTFAAPPAARPPSPARCSSTSSTGARPRRRLRRRRPRLPARAARPHEPGRAAQAADRRRAHARPAEGGADVGDGRQRRRGAPLRQAELHLELRGWRGTSSARTGSCRTSTPSGCTASRQQGKILLPVGKAKGSFIDARDIAAVAAALLTSDDFDNREFDLTGAEALDHDEVAAILSRETGRTIRFQDITPEAMLAGLLGAGLPRRLRRVPAAHPRLLQGRLRRAHHRRRAAITGRAPRRFAAYAKDYRSAWLA